MTFQAISRAQNLHTPRYMAGKQFHNGHGVKSIDCSGFFGPEKIEKIGGAPLQGILVLPRVESKSRPYQTPLSRAL